MKFAICGWYILIIAVKYMNPLARKHNSEQCSGNSKIGII